MCGTLEQRVRRNTHDHYQFCSCPREMYLPSINACLLMFQEVRSISKTYNQLIGKGMVRAGGPEPVRRRLGIVAEPLFALSEVTIGALQVLTHALEGRKD